MQLKFVPVERGGSTCPVCGRRVLCVGSPLDVEILGTCAHYEGTGTIGQQAIVFRTEKSCDQTTAAKESTT
jgi:hypothetical protein